MYDECDIFLYTLIRNCLSSDIFIYIYNYIYYVLCFKGKACLTVHFLCYRDLLSDVEYEITWEALRHVLNAHPHQNVSILLEKTLTLLFFILYFDIAPNI